MSLTSRLANLFTSSPPPHFAPTDDNPPLRSFGVGGYGARQDTQFTKDRRKQQDESMEEEEEARPPYLHV